MYTELKRIGEERSRSSDVTSTLDFWLIKLMMMKMMSVTMFTSTRITNSHTKLQYRNTTAIVSQRLVSHRHTITAKGFIHKCCSILPQGTIINSAVSLNLFWRRGWFHLGARTNSAVQSRIPLYVSISSTLNVCKCICVSFSNWQFSQGRHSVHSLQFSTARGFLSLTGLSEKSRYPIFYPGIKGFFFLTFQVISLHISYTI